jgi:hypothetical protein
MSDSKTAEQQPTSNSRVCDSLAEMISLYAGLVERSGFGDNTQAVVTQVLALLRELEQRRAAHEPEKAPHYLDGLTIEQWREHAKEGWRQAADLRAVPPNARAVPPPPAATRMSDVLREIRGEVYGVDSKWHTPIEALERIRKIVEQAIKGAASPPGEGYSQAYADQMRTALLTLLKDWAAPDSTPERIITQALLPSTKRAVE